MQHKFESTFFNRTWLIKYGGGSLLILTASFMAQNYPRFEAYQRPVNFENFANEQADAKDWLSWQLLETLDLKTGMIKDPALQEKINMPVMIPGFAVILEDSRNTKEFLLVPNALACIHVPAPPPNQMILVKLDEELSHYNLTGPILVSGILRISSKESNYGTSGFTLDGYAVRGL